MFLLIPITHKTYIRIKLFTFHNVSINSKEYKVYVNDTNIFTFHNVSINSKSVALNCHFLHHLHSTMFLLIQEQKLEMANQESYLHSTMFLLIPSCNTAVSAFVIYLHSTMFLLIPVT